MFANSFRVLFGAGHNLDIPEAVELKASSGLKQASKGDKLLQIS